MEDLTLQTAESITCISELARRAMEASSGDIGLAAETLYSQVAKDGAAYKEMADPLIRRACRDACAQVRGEVRDLLWKQPDAREVKARFERAVLARSVFDWPLSNGVRLGDATREMLEEEVGAYSAEIKALTERKAWLQKIALRLTEGQKVAEKLSEEEVEGMKG